MNINDTLQYLNIGLPDDIARQYPMFANSLLNLLRNAETPEAAQDFDRLGYRFSPAHSTAASYVFLREGRAN